MLIIWAPPRRWRGQALRCIAKQARHAAAIPGAGVSRRILQENCLGQITDLEIL